MNIDMNIDINIDMNIDNNKLLRLQSYINDATLQIKSLDYYFYENIDSGLIQHPDLCKFAINMENIQVNILNILQHIENIVFVSKVKCDGGNKTDNKTDDNVIDIQVSNIDYLQLQSLGNFITK